MKYLFPAISNTRPLFSYLVFFFLTIALESFSQDGIKQLIDFRNKSSIRNIVFDDATAKLTTVGGKPALRCTLGHNADRPSVKFTFPPTDLSKYVGIAMDIKNEGSETIAIEAQCFNENVKSVGINDGAKFYYRSMIVLHPGETDSLLIILSRATDSLPSYVKNALPGMFGLPGGFVRRKENIDLTRLTNISLFKEKLGKDYTVTVSNIRAVGDYHLPDESLLKKNFFPFVDEFGQYRYASWPGKVSAVEDFKTQKSEEEHDLALNKGNSDWDQYGGWQSGPTLKATGYFRTEKYQNKWWLVDPEGKLFWSLGINIVGFSQRTPIQGRENYFAKVPARGDFYYSNLMLKYGSVSDSALLETASKTIFSRLQSWGINTLADNSHPFLYAQKKIPYTIEVRSGIVNPLPDTLDEATFRKSFAGRLQRSDIINAANDPWCIGFFVDNELAWPKQNPEKSIEAYFRIVHEELKKFAPEKLYLGCRINSPNFNRAAFEASAKYCDVISINHYDYNVSDFKETKGLDKPIIIGEFHFGALDRGLFHPGLRAVSNQKQRGRVYSHFVEDALSDPAFVGVHWFQYVDQVCSGRGDGENYQIGFVDICDRPYPEMVSAAREIASRLYVFRQNQKKSNVY